MTTLDEIKTGSHLVGIEGSTPVEVIAVEQMGEQALTLYYKTQDGRTGEQMLFSSDLDGIEIAKNTRPWSFDAPADEFKLALEAYRINMAHLFDPMMAIHTSNVVPLPHQITAVYESMLPKQPLRFVLADDPGAGKTIMAGLFIRELIMRADGMRILIVSPGSLVEQWQDELYEKFGLSFKIFSRELDDTSMTGNPFQENNLLIARLDQLSRNDAFKEKLKAVEWDLVVVDEAHKLSASFYGNEVKRTKRFMLGELLGRTTRHFLLMTATPHNGKEEDFQLFMSLLDADRFYGKFRDGVHKVDISDLMRRMVKEDLLKFDGTPLFPERRAYTVNYRLSDLEAALYHQVTNYVKTEMNRAERLDKKRKGTVGFALTALQRRLASSPAAIYESLKRRRQKLQRRLEELKLLQRGGKVSEIMSQEWARIAPENLDEAFEEMPDSEYEAFEEEIVDQATAAQTIQELEAEIESLKFLVEQARSVVHSGNDRKWEELSRLLQDNEHMVDEEGHRRKLIIFTEHKDTLNYLYERITDLYGSRESVVVIHGGIHRDKRREAQELFRNDPQTLVLLATDAAGEGVNLQNANLMINYDLPWNPNRLEQRFGRIHRIGQTEVCHLWNLVASETREGDVFQRLFEKLEVERKALGGRVFDILGEAFDNKSLKDLLIEAIMYGDDPEVRARLERSVEGALDTEHLKQIIERNALAQETIGIEQLYHIREEMEKAEARKLQPYFIRSFFLEAFQKLNGTIKQREPGRYEIRHVPSIVKERDRIISASRTPVLNKYERICFEKELVRVPKKPMAELMHPAHPLMHAITDLTLELHRDQLKRGSVLLDPNDESTEPKLLFVITHTVKEATGEQKVASKRLQFVEIDRHGKAMHAGWAPHLDLLPLPPEARKKIEPLLHENWLEEHPEKLALHYAIEHLVPEHYQEVKSRREHQIDKTKKAVYERLTKEISFWQDRYLKLKEEVSAGKQPRMQPENARKKAEELNARLQQRLKELETMQNVVSSTPVVLGGALVVPQGLLDTMEGKAQEQASADERARIERIAMQAVMEREKAKGNYVIDVSDQKCGWDITSRPPKIDGKIGQDLHIEVKGRAKGQTTITVSKNEIIYALNQKEKFVLAIVIVDGESYEGPYYIKEPFEKEPDFGVASINYNLGELLKRAEQRT
jgi:superfamily II DNA or RNA helicase